MKLYLKCAWAALAASAIAAFAVYGSSLLEGVALKHKYQSAGHSIRIEVHYHLWTILYTALVVFAIAFYWEFRRAISPSRGI